VPTLVAILAVVAGCTTLLPERGGGGGAVADAPATDRRVDTEAIDRLFAEYDAPGVPGAAVAVVHQGRVVHARGYGLAELERGSRVSERTSFRLASLTKPFTAMATLLLVREGRLDLEDPVHAVLPDFPEYARAVRIRHLLTHTSGLQPYPELVPPSSVRHVKDRDVLTLLKKRADRLQFRPGSEFRYGDSCYAVLALVIETVSGQPFARFLHDRIFVPSGMTAALAWEPGGPAVPHRAYGYTATRRGFHLSDHSNTSTVLGDGGIYASIRDLIAWDRALDDQRVLDAGWLALAWTPTVLSDGTTAPYGLGWFLDERTPGGRSVFHHGITSGFNNVYVKYPDARLTIIVLTNRRGGRAREIAAAIAALPSFREAAAR
jgi:CubicO group peptidase (beta-lactamase class C family)